MESRRPDLGTVPLAFASLELQELGQADQTKLTAAQIRAKEENVIRYYRRAIDLGSRNSEIVRETVRLLFRHKRGNEAMDLVKSIPVESRVATDLERQALAFALDSRDFEHAEGLARKAVAAKPADLSERIWLVRILLAQGRRAEAEAVIREAVALAKNDPDRHIVLVEFLLETGQPAQAVKVINDAEASLPPLKATVPLGHCYALLGRFYEGKDEGEKKKWYARANEMYAKAQADRPDDLALAKGAAEFFIKTSQPAELEAQLEAAVRRGSKETSPWARRTLAVLLASSRDVQRSCAAHRRSSSRPVRPPRAPRARAR